jgi:ATP-dependent RNA helicase DHX33
MIGITQPRRVAAITVARRVAVEKDCSVGQLVGYAVRFEDNTSEQTKIKYMTDGTLLREALNNRLLTKYSCIILDEAHERTLSTDILFGIVKNAQLKRRQKQMDPLKIIVMSATMDVDHFHKYFPDSDVVILEGRTFTVKVHSPINEVANYGSVVFNTIFQIHEDGDEK